METTLANCVLAVAAAALLAAPGAVRAAETSWQQGQEASQALMETSGAALRQRQEASQVVMEVFGAMGRLEQAIMAAYAEPLSCRTLLEHRGGTLAQVPGWYLVPAWQAESARLVATVARTLPGRGGELRQALAELTSRLATDVGTPEVAARNDALITLRLERVKAVRLAAAQELDHVARLQGEQFQAGLERQPALQHLRDLRSELEMLQGTVKHDASLLGRGLAGATLERRAVGPLDGLLGAWYLQSCQTESSELSAIRAAQALDSLEQSRPVVEAKEAVEYVQAGVFGPLAWDPGASTTTVEHRALLRLRDERLPEALRSLDQAITGLAGAASGSTASAIGLLGTSPAAGLAGAQGGPGTGGPLRPLPPAGLALVGNGARTRPSLPRGEDE